MSLMFNENGYTLKVEISIFVVISNFLKVDLDKDKYPSTIK